MSYLAFGPPGLPPGLESLAELALDLRWTWSHQGDHLWRQIDPQAWEATRNPWLILQEVSRDRLVTLAGDSHFVETLGELLDLRQRYLSSSMRLGPAAAVERSVAYFSMEYGLGDAIPLYAGGLGVLAGDHLEAASDLGVPIVAVGLLYQEGYFRQMVDAAGRQEELYPYNDPTVLPIQPTLAPSGGWLKVPVEFPGRTVWLRVWRALVGRVTLYLLDSNVPLNQPADRGITGKLYGDGPEMRLRQEIVLGIGGWRALELLDIQPGACHLNEGHAAFAVLERARGAMRTLGIPFDVALSATRAGNVFTTHTPVDAGFDAFAPALLAKYFPDGRGMLGDLGITFRQFLSLGQSPGSATDDPFRPAYLAIHGAGRVNAVSALHGETSRQLFRQLFPRWTVADIPVGHVTNGVHVPSWDSSFSDEMWTAACGPDRWRRPIEDQASAIACVDDGTLWLVRARARKQLVGQVRGRLARQLARRGAEPSAIEETERALDADVLTLAFARRFAEYKRPNLLLRDQDRLRRLLTDAQRPIQLVVAGKAHPADQRGKALVEEWIRFTSQPAVRTHCVFLEDYDLTLAQELVQGVDVWINTPRRPWEACGTSGMKILVNGGLNLSVRDGWWAEAFDPEVGWAIPGRATDGSGDDADAEALFEILERQVIPAFYQRDNERLPRDWLRRVRASLSRLTPRFSATRMLSEYLSDYYRPAETELLRRMANGAAVAREIVERGRRLAAHWPALRFGKLEFQCPRDDEAKTTAEVTFEVVVEVFLDDLSSDEVTVELYADASGGHARERIAMAAVGALPGTANGHLFRTRVLGGRPVTDYTPRLIPASRGQSVPQELGFITWHH